MDINWKRVATFGLWRPKAPPAAADGTAQHAETTERGRIATPENSTRYLYNQLYVDPRLRSAILMLRHMDRIDGRVKKIHKRMARQAVKGGLRIEFGNEENAKVQTLWDDFVRRLRLDDRNKLESDARGAVMEGNLSLQRVVDTTGHVTALIRMPTETLVPKVDLNGRFTDPAKAYVQVDHLTYNELASFALWQLAITRLDPDNFDDQGALGRPYLDATRSVWQKLVMTEDDMVIRRRTRSPLRMAHSLEGATKEELDEYRNQIEADQHNIATDFYMNKKGGVQAVQGDANLDQIADVAYLLDTFFAGSPAPKGLFGYVGDLNRDVLEDLKADYYEEIDGLQDVLARAYHEAFCLELLLQGIDPDSHKFTVLFPERQTETRNQRADLALKAQAMGASQKTVFELAGLDPVQEKARLKSERAARNPYPDAHAGGGAPSVSITPGNRPKGESATSISNE